MQRLESLESAGVEIPFHDYRVLPDQESFNAAMAERFGLEKILPRCKETQGLGLVVAKGDTSNRWRDAAVTKLRDKDTEYMVMTLLVLMAGVVTVASRLGPFCSPPPTARRPRSSPFPVRYPPAVSTPPPRL